MVAVWSSPPLVYRDDSGVIRVKIHFADTGIDVNVFDADGDNVAVFDATASGTGGTAGFGVTRYDEFGVPEAEHALTLSAILDDPVLALDSVAVLTLANAALLPTANPGPGLFWNDAGTVKVGT